MGGTPGRGPVGSGRVEGAGGEEGPEDLAPPVRALCIAVTDDKGDVVAVLQAAWCGGEPASQQDTVGAQVRAGSL